MRPPDFTRCLRRTPRRLPNGAWVDPRPLTPAEAERLRPPDQESDYARWRASDRAAGSPRWHRAQGKMYLHDGPAWGVSAGKWSWMRSEGGRWWLSADGRTLVWHQDLWWWRDSGSWFYLLDGQPRLWESEEFKLGPDPDAAWNDPSKILIRPWKE